MRNSEYTPNIEVYTPSEWPDHYSFYEPHEDRRQRRALALIAAFGSPGGGDKVAFLDNMIIIAAPPIEGHADMELTIRPLEEFLEDYGETCKREGDPLTLRWVEKIAEWPDLGC